MPGILSLSSAMHCQWGHLLLSLPHRRATAFGVKHFLKQQTCHCWSVRVSQAFCSLRKHINIKHNANNFIKGIWQISRCPKESKARAETNSTSFIIIPWFQYSKRKLNHLLCLLIFNYTNPRAWNLANITGFRTLLLLIAHSFYKCLSSVYYSKALCWALEECHGEQKATRTLPHQALSLLGGDGEAGIVIKSSHKQIWNCSKCEFDGELCDS